MPHTDTVCSEVPIIRTSFPESCSLSTDPTAGNAAASGSAIGRIDNVDGFEPPFGLSGPEQKWPVSQQLWDAYYQMFLDPAHRPLILADLKANPDNASLVERLENSDSRAIGALGAIPYITGELARCYTAEDELWYSLLWSFSRFTIGTGQRSRFMTMTVATSF